MNDLISYLLNFAGRARRSEYGVYLFSVLLSLLAFSGAYCSLFYDVHPLVWNVKTMIDMAIFAISIVATVGAAMGYVSITVRRLHDIGLSGIFAFLLFVPGVGAPFLLLLNLLTPGQKRPQPLR